MLTKTRGIVFRSIKYRESSLILEIYTQHLGLQKYIVNGVRSRSARTKANLYQVLSPLDLVVYHRENKDLNRIREAKSAFVYEGIPFDVRRGAVGMFIAEVARKTIRASEENQPLYQFLEDTLRHLDRCASGIGNIHLFFLLRLSEFLGFMPDTDAAPGDFFDLQEGVYVRESSPHGYILGPDLALLLAQLQESSLETCHEVKMSKSVRNQLLDKLIVYYRLHLEHLSDIHSHTILRTLF